ncbi:hypothetical protein DAPPUDRAFT_312639 [Daphnia pulex]|uniref:Ubiquitin-like domain-containing protein n=1 Tax=Daphnia pulex TaxID=6669 RepID=E9FZS2_DAPPU|nr:hypothetical protein DAPPUDRAFT_312639 [Daphnia pulex]|eukprot:EFX87215.1 hypothetical protein DAPPUDRAFT_312639 [Daphnia pulex]
MEVTGAAGGATTQDDCCAADIPQQMYVQVEQRPPVPVSTRGDDSPTGAAAPSTGRYVVTVKLECPDSQVITQAWTLATSAGSLKERLSRMVELPVGTLHLIHGGKAVQDHVTLGELGGRVNETISLSLRSVDPVAFPIRIKSSLPPEDLMPLPDVITVRIHTKNVPDRDLVVEIENQSVCQPFLGGWRRKNNGVCYYHAETQTDYTVGPDDRLRILTPGPRSKDCQVATIRDNHTQSSSSVSCQVRGFDWNLSSRDDDSLNATGRFVAPLDDADKSRRVKRCDPGENPYTPRPCSVTSSLAESIDNNNPAIEPVEALIIRFGDVTIEKNRINEVDNQLDNHRIIFHEIEILNSTKSSAVKDRILRRLLHRISQPKVWRSSTGAIVEVDTVEIEYLREMRLMYEAVCNSTLTEERVRALHLLKRTATLEEERAVSQGTPPVGRS